MMHLALIPARGGSKRIPDKNIRDFAGVPALGRVVDCIRSTGVFSKVLVSTDSEVIGRVAIEYGAAVVERNPTLADDQTSLLDVVKSHLPSLEIDQQGVILACVLPTALLMSRDDLAEACQMVIGGKSQFVVSVGRFSYPIQRALRYRSDKTIEMFWPENYSARSQDFELAFHDAGQFYVGSVDSWQTRTTMFDAPTSGLLIDDLRVQDIDVEDDWHNAERLWRVLGS